MDNGALTECPTCEGCGQVADNDAMTPWVHRWKGLMGPLLCPRCGGKGLIFEDENEETDE